MEGQHMGKGLTLGVVEETDVFKINDDDDDDDE